MGVDLGRVVFFDVETTGTDPQTDRIVEMAFVEGDTGEVLLNVRVNPERPIPEEATAVHGISDADVAGLEPFRAHADVVQRIVERSVLGSYNGIRFDSLLVDKELRQAGKPGLRKDEEGRLDHPEIDLFAIWRRMESRSLAGALERFDVDFEESDLHSSADDAGVLRLLLPKLLDGLSVPDEADLVELSLPEGAVDREGKFRRRDDGRIVLNFGKHRGAWVASQVGYLEWMMKGDGFSPDTLAWVRYFLREIRAHTPAGSGG